MSSPRSIYSPANPDNPMIFQRIPFHKRLHWLWLWDATNDPADVDCTLAMDTLAYFTDSKQQAQMRYYEGEYKGIIDAKRDFDLCLSVRGIANSNPEKAKQLLVERTKEKEVETEHVWKFRENPKHLKFPY